MYPPIRKIYVENIYQLQMIFLRFPMDFPHLIMLLHARVKEMAGIRHSVTQTTPRHSAEFTNIGFHGLENPPGTIPIGSMYAIYDNIYHQYTPHVSIFTIHGSYG
jgi:hypothetical protein